VSCVWCLASRQKIADLQAELQRERERAAQLERELLEPKRERCQDQIVRVATV
jgi:hypothetical protein